MPSQPHVVIVGGGFGGLNAARALRSAPVRITLIDRRNHHLFQPLLYQVATASLSPAEIASPIRGILRRQANVEVRMGEVTEVRTGAGDVVLRGGTRIPYDYLILATGATHDYFGNPQWSEFAPGLKTVEDALRIRRRFLLAFEAAEQESDPEVRAAMLTFVVVGAGPTGAEMAGAMAEIANRAMKRDFRRIDPKGARILLVEGADRVLSAYDPRLSAKARQALERLGVTVRTDAFVTGVDRDGVSIGEERIPTRHVVWAAGVAASPLGGKLGVPTDRAGRVVVEKDLSIPGHPNVFVVGDLAQVIGEGGQPVPGIAPAATQQGRAAARNVRLSLEGRPCEPFRYNDKGNMATIGRAEAIAEIKGLRISGLAAWLAWLFVHIFFLIGFRNRLIVLIQWANSYLFWRRGARLITGEVEPEPVTPPARSEAPAGVERTSAGDTSSR